MAYPCTDDPQEVIAQVLEAVDNSQKLDTFVNGEVSETVQLGDGDPTPSLRGVVQRMLDLAEEAIVYDEEHPEFVRYYKDSEGKFIWGIRLDGSIDWAAGVPKPVREFVERFVKNVFVPGGQDVLNVVDASGKFLFGVHRDGTFDWAAGVPKPVREFVERFVRVRHDAAGCVVSATEDARGKAVSFMDDKGGAVHFGDMSVFGDVKISGSIDCDMIKGVCNWTKSSSIKIPEIPKCAVVNLRGFSRPVDKQDERQAVMEFWDGRGNYFEKNILIGLQGSTTWNLPKPNYKFDVVKGGWNDLDEGGDLETCKIQFGEWMPSDSFHLKAFWTDFTKCRAIICYRIWDEINKTYPIDRDATWKRAMLPADPCAPNGELPAFSCTQNLDLRLDTGATCRFGGFPCLVYHNGEFYGIFAWQQKKQRDNFMMDKKNASHIHLDGAVGQSLCAGSPDYAAFEIRNPNKLVCWDGSDYDGDVNRQRLVSRADSAWQNKDKFKNTEKVDQAIRAIAAHLAEIGDIDAAIQAMVVNSDTQENINAAVANLKETFETYFDPENIIDMAVQLTWDDDNDSVTNNIQWTTWDGVKWYFNRYDANGAFEGNFRWHFKPGTVSHIMGGTTKNHPFYIIEKYYFEEACGRYAELRRAKILDADHFMSMVQEWMLSVGADFYKKEFELWPMQNCLGEAVENKAFWRLVLDENNKPIRCDSETASAEDRALPTFSLNATYQPGAVVKAAYTDWYQNAATFFFGAFGYWKMECVAPGPCRGVQPYDVRFMNAPDSVYRLYNWIKLRQEQVDELFGYAG